MGKLRLNDSNESLLYKAIVKRLRQDPDLSRVIRTWCVFDGTVGEVADPAEQKLPYVMILPVADQASIETERSTTSPLTLSIMVVTDGTDATDPMNVWAAIRGCLFPGDNSLQQLLQQYGGYRMVIGKPSYGRVKAGGAFMMVAEGSLKIDILVSTGS